MIEAVVDPFEPPMPPSVTIEQAAHFAKSLAKGEANRKKIALAVAEDKISRDGLKGGERMPPPPGALYVNVAKQHEHDNDR